MRWEDGERNLVLYADDGKISRQDHQWAQDALTLTVEMFRRMGLNANLEKTKTTVYTNGFDLGEWDGY